MVVERKWFGEVYVYVFHLCLVDSMLSQEDSDIVASCISICCSNAG